MPATVVPKPGVLPEPEADGTDVVDAMELAARGKNASDSTRVLKRPAAGPWRCTGRAQDAYDAAYKSAFEATKKAKQDHKKILTRAQVAGQKARRKVLDEEAAAR